MTYKGKVVETSYRVLKSDKYTQIQIILLSKQSIVALLIVPSLFFLIVFFRRRCPKGDGDIQKRMVESPRTYFGGQSMSVRSIENAG